MFSVKDSGLENPFSIEDSFINSSNEEDFLFPLWVWTEESPYVTNRPGMNVANPNYPWHYPEEENFPLFLSLLNTNPVYESELIIKNRLLDQTSIDIQEIHYPYEIGQAKAQLKSLQDDLTKLSTMSAIGSFNNADMEKAINRLSKAIDEKETIIIYDYYHHQFRFNQL